MPCAKHPRTGLPFRSPLAVDSLKRQYEADGFANAAFENTTKPFTFLRIVEFIVLRVDIYREFPLLHHVGHWILIGTNDVIRFYRQASRKFFRKPLGLGLTETIITIG